MVINTKNIIKFPQDIYDVEWAIELLDMGYGLPEWFWISYEWARCKRSRVKLVHELQVNLSDGEI